MYAENRRQERKPSALSTVGELDGITKVINLSGFEKEGLYLEGTGSMVLDRVNRIVYCCASERSSPDVLNEYCSELDYTYVFFTAADRDKRPIYHTNVMMCVAEKEYAVICLESIQEDAMRTNVINSLSNTGTRSYRSLWSKSCTLPAACLGREQYGGITPADECRSQRVA